jgi:hypothetical protein
MLAKVYHKDEKYGTDMVWILCIALATLLTLSYNHKLAIRLAKGRRIYSYSNLPTRGISLPVIIF